MPAAPSVAALHRSIVDQLVTLGRESGYRADADEPDPRYKSYRVRMAGKRGVVRAHRSDIRMLSPDGKLALARRLVESGYGEEQELGLFVLQQMVDYFEPANLGIVDALVRRLYGWSKIDGFTGGLLQPLLLAHRDPMVDLARAWNRDPDRWPRRASVVLFTRKVAASGDFTDIAVELCDNLVWDRDDGVRKGVGWALKDLARSDQARVVAYVKDLRAAGVSSVITNYAIRNLDPERAAVLAVKPTRPG